MGQSPEMATASRVIVANAFFLRYFQTLLFREFPHGRQESNDTAPMPQTIRTSESARLPTRSNEGARSAHQFAAQRVRFTCWLSGMD